MAKRKQTWERAARKRKALRVRKARNAQHDAETATDQKAAEPKAAAGGSKD